jgi:hypothetical protein
MSFYDDICFEEEKSFKLFLEGGEEENADTDTKRMERSGEGDTRWLHNDGKRDCNSNSKERSTESRAVKSPTEVGLIKSKY